MKQNLIFITLMLLCAAVSESRGENHVLSLDGYGDYVRIPNAPELQGGKNVVKTIEAWFRYASYSTQGFMPKEMPFPVVGKTLDGNAKDWAINLNKEFGIHFHSGSGGGDYRPSAPSGLILMNQWYHIAVVINRPEQLLRLYLNGVLVAEYVNMGNESAETGAPVEIGAYSYMSSFAFGYINEVRIWNVARTEEQIRETMLTSLHGDEPGLVGYWQFEGEGQKVLDASPNEHHGEMIGDAKRIVIELPNRVQSVPKPARISGVVSDDKGKPIPNAIVRLEQARPQAMPSNEVKGKRRDELEIASATTNAEGNYRMSIYPVRGLYDLSATSGNLGDWQLGIRLHEGERRTLNFTLKESISISGTLLMLDEATPHVACVVQAVRPLPNGEGEPTVIATTLTDENGQYHFINLKPATYQVRCYTLNGYVYHQQGKRLTVEKGKSLTNTDFHFASFKKGTWRNYTIFDGLAGNLVRVVCGGPEMTLWFGGNGGVSHYDGETFQNLTTRDGLASDAVLSIHRALDGTMWFGTLYGGVSHYDGKTIVTFTETDGLGSNHVPAIHQDPDGTLWFGSGFAGGFKGGGVSRYNGKTFQTFTKADGLSSNVVTSIHRDSDGVLWFGLGYEQAFSDKSIFRYDGTEFVPFPQAFKTHTVSAIYQDSDGVMWFAGYGGGVLHYDGTETAMLTPQDGLIGSLITTIHQDVDGNLWFGQGIYGGGTREGGASCYDGKGFVNFTKADGLMSDAVSSIYQDIDGVLWFGTDNGVYRYDERTFQNFTTRDGLIHNKINAMYVAPDGTMWLATAGGISKYDGQEFQNFTKEDGLLHNDVLVITSGVDGELWAGGSNGISRFVPQEVLPTDGTRKFSRTGRFLSLTEDAEFVKAHILACYRAKDGSVWFGTIYNGVYQYDGEALVNFSDENGFEGKWIGGIHEDDDGTMWFGGTGGFYQYDGKAFVKWTPKEGLSFYWGSVIHRDTDGTMWLATSNGVFRYDGQGFTTFTVEDGLAQNSVNVIYQDKDSRMWFGTGRGGVSFYDGQAWTSLDSRDGLASNKVTSIHQDEDGAMWFGTDGGLTRYRPSQTKPLVRIVKVTTDREYTDFSAIVPVTTGHRASIKYSAIDFKTIPEKRQYRYRINEIDNDWRRPTKSSTFDYIFKKPGNYTFSVQTIDRDLNYSDPVSLTLKVVPPWYLNGWIAFPSGGAILALLIGFIVFGSRYYVQRRESQKLRKQMLQQEREGRETLQAQNIQLQEAKETAEVAREEAETANQAKSIFLANMSHEIRTPMNAVLGYAQILQRDHELLQRQRDAVDTIENSGLHLLALINDVLDISKIEAGRLELQETDFDLKALIDGIAAMFQMRCEREGLTWRVEGIDEDRVLVHGDEGKLRQVLINLLGNAVKFTESGEVVLRISESTDQRNGRMEGFHVSRFTHHASRFTFEVIDTGIGIPPEAQAKIFEPFQQSEEGAQKGGTGLGLTISKRQIELMGGELSLQSEVGVGSNFFFTLTFEPATSDVIHQASRYSGVTRLAAGYDITALIADDTKVNRDVLSRMLTDLGVEVIEAENGKQAVEMFRSHKPDIVFMDIRMPVMDGLEATRRLFEEFDKNQLKIVAISASTLRHEQEEYFQAGFDDFIPKPFRFEQLCGCLAKVLAVEYEYADAVSDDEEEVAEIDLTQVILPEDLLSRLKEAAEMYSLTELNQCFAEMEELGEDVRPLVDRLRELARNQDMEEILNILSEYQKS